MASYACLVDHIYPTENDATPIIGSDMNPNPAPVAFLSHAHEDNVFVDRLARDLMASGIDVFNDDWEIGPGDSIVQKVNNGLGRCTHFLVVLTPVALTKPWVSREMDVGFVNLIRNQAKFIPLRVGLSAADLPELLRPINSPSMDDYEKDVVGLISFLLGADRKPPLGPARKAIRLRGTSSGLSPNAEEIARFIVENSEQGRCMDPMVSPQTLRDKLGISDDDIVEAVQEMEQAGLVRRHQNMGDGPIGFGTLTPEACLFVRLDPVFGFGDPEVDARRFASDMLNSETQDANVDELAVIYQWTPRRMNPALECLISRDLVLASRAMDQQWTSAFVKAKPGLRSFLRQGNG